jgi:hypothetical protein
MVGAPQKRGVLFMVSAMLEIEDFLEDQIRQCKLLAEDASDKSDREFWVRAANRWEALLADRHGLPDVEVRLEHPYRRRKRSYLRKQQRRVA